MTKITFDAETFASNPAFQSDTPDDDIPDVPEENSNEPDMKEPPAPQENEGYFCDGCGVGITEKVYEYSLNKYGRRCASNAREGWADNETDQDYYGKPDFST